MSDARHLFRQTALNRLSSPDQLDQLLPATAPARWIALVGAAILIGAAVVWTVTGDVPTRVQGRGVLLARGGSVIDATAVASGTLASVLTRVGDTVEKGQVLAQIVQPELMQSVDNARTQAKELAAEHERLTQQFALEATQKRDVLMRQRAAQQTIVDGARQRSAYYLQTLNDLENQVERGYITRQRMQDARQEWQTAEQEITRVSAELIRLDGAEIDESSRRTDALTTSAMQVSEAARRVAGLEAQLELDTRVVAPTAGTVIEVKAQTGAFLATGTPLIGIQTGTEGLELNLYIPLGRGKDVLPGMTVQIEPTTVKKEEYGTILGRVTTVSEFPATTQGMMAVLQNGDLVRQFSKPGPPYSARVELMSQPGGNGGYLWSSGSGPPLTITSGTLAEAEITVRRQHPIALVLPALDNILGWSR